MEVPLQIPIYLYIFIYLMPISLCVGDRKTANNKYYSAMCLRKKNSLDILLRAMVMRGQLASRHTVVELTLQEHF